MDNQRKAEYLTRLRAELTFFVSSTLDNAMRQLDGTSDTASTDMLVPIVIHPAFFKGRKPAETIFPNGEVVPTSTWKKFVLAIMADALQSESMRQILLSLRGRVWGRNRVILDASPKEMNQPLELCEGMYLETKFDTETLLYVLLERILHPIGYDPIGIRILLRP